MNGWLWAVVVECNRPTTTPPPTPPNTDDKDDDGRGLYVCNFMQDNVNFMHNSSRHQQFKLPSPAGAEQALRGASDD